MLTEQEKVCIISNLCMNLASKYFEDAGKVVDPKQLFVCKNGKLVNGFANFDSKSTWSGVDLTFIEYGVINFQVEIPKRSELIENTASVSLSLDELPSTNKEELRKAALSQIIKGFNDFRSERSASDLSKTFVDPTSSLKNQQIQREACEATAATIFAGNVYLHQKIMQICSK